MSSKKFSVFSKNFSKKLNLRRLDHVFSFQQKVQWNKIGSSFVGPAKDICQFKLSPLSSPAFLPGKAKFIRKEIKMFFWVTNCLRRSKNPDKESPSNNERKMDIYFVPLKIMKFILFVQANIVYMGWRQITRSPGSEQPNKVRFQTVLTEALVV